MIMGPIWWTAVQQYCEAKELEDDQIAAMHYLIKEMDKAFMEYQEKKQSKADKTGKKTL